MLCAGLVPGACAARAFHRTHPAHKVLRGVSPALSLPPVTGSHPAQTLMLPASVWGLS